MKEELKGYADSGDEKLEAYAHSEDELLESRLHDWVWDNRHAHPNLALGGSNAGPDRGMVYYNGRPLCDINREWDLDDATVVCRMLGFSKATKYYYNCPTDGTFGSCPPAGIPFAMSGFQCTGSESHILDCPHDATLSSTCGDHNGFTNSGGNDIVGVECE